MKPANRRLTRWVDTEEASPEEPSVEQDVVEGDDVTEAASKCTDCGSPSVAFDDPSEVNSAWPSVPLCRPCILSRL